HLSCLVGAEIGVEPSVQHLEVESSAAAEHYAGSSIAKCLSQAVLAPVLGLPVDDIAGEADELAGFALRRVEEAEIHGRPGTWRVEARRRRAAVRPSGAGPRDGRVRADPAPRPAPASRGRPASAPPRAREAGGCGCRGWRC